MEDRLVHNLEDETVSQRPRPEPKHNIIDTINKTIARIKELKVKS